MTDLEAAVPPHEPAEDALAFAGKAALGLIPIVGSLASETLAHALETRQAARQHEFNVLVARSLTRTIESQEEALTVADVVDSSEFVAALTRAQRTAAESTSESQRRRLAAAVVSSGKWASFGARERSEFTKLVENYDDLHVWLLHYLDDPEAWLSAHGLADDRIQGEGVLAQRLDPRSHRKGDDNPIVTALGVPWVDVLEPITQVVTDLKAARLVATNPADERRMAHALYARTTAKGRRFLAFIAEPDSVAAEAPSAL